MKHKKIACLTVLLIGGAAATGWRFYSHKGEAVPTYEPVRMERSHMEKTIEATAIVQPRNRIEIKPPIGGHIDEVLVDEGQEVHKGDIVARMSSTERATLLDAARARGEEVLKKWEDAYKATSLIAPLDGTIISRDTEPGQTVTTQDSVLVLSDRLIVSAQVDETDIGTVRDGQRVHITLDAYQDVEISGKVTRIAYEATTVNNVTIYEVEIQPERIPTCMKSGMTSTVNFIIAEAENVLTLPIGAVQSGRRGQFVFVQYPESDEPPERCMVKTGLSSNGRIEIVSGLNEHDHVVKTTFAIQRTEKGPGSPFVQAPPGRKRP